MPFEGSGLPAKFKFLEKCKISRCLWNFAFVNQTQNWWFQILKMREVFVSVSLNGKAKNRFCVKEARINEFVGDRKRWIALRKDSRGIWAEGGRPRESVPSGNTANITHFKVKSVLSLKIKIFFFLHFSFNSTHRNLECREYIGAFWEGGRGALYVGAFLSMSAI